MRFTVRGIGRVVGIGCVALGVGGRAKADTPVAVDVAITLAAEPTSALHDALLQAIKGQRLLHFTYGGQSRVVEPHAYGVNPNGEAVLHGYQVAGGSNSEPPPGWRTFSVAKIEGLVAAQAGFSGPRRDYSGERLKLDPLWAELMPATED